MTTTAHSSIGDLFVRPIGRPINGVIKAGQQDDANVTQELEEYVVTRELDGQFRQVFRALRRLAGRARPTRSASGSAAFSAAASRIS